MDHRIRISPQPVDQAAAHDWLAGDGDAGAVVVFTGHVRDEQGQISGLELEHFPGMAEAEIGRLVEQAAERWSLQRVWVEHRVGQLGVADLIVLVGVASGHRQAAFEAAAWIMDFLKTRVPLWKKSLTCDGDAVWMTHRQRDQDAAQRWENGED